MEFTWPLPFAELLGIELVRFERGESELILPLRKELTNSWDVAHGGAIMTLLDITLAHAARSPGQAGLAEDIGVVTIEMKTSFLRAGTGDRLRAVGRVLRRTPSFAFCEGSMFDGKGELAAHATGTFKYMKRLQVGEEKVQRAGASD